MKYKILGLLTAIVVICSACMSISNEEVMAEQPKVKKEIIIQVQTPEPTPYPDFDLDHLSIIRKEGFEDEEKAGNVYGDEYSTGFDDSTNATCETAEEGSGDGLYREAGTGNNEPWGINEGDGEDDSEFTEYGPDYESVEEGSDKIGLIYLGDWTVTAYCPCAICCGEWATGCTASGVLATAKHTVACGILPFGTQIMIDGVIYTVEDTGVDGEWIDIFFDSHEEALAFGMQTKGVYLVG